MNLMRPLFAALALLTLSACGDDNAEIRRTIRQGVFVDAPVCGLSFSSPSQSGLTNVAGLFTYGDGETVQFSIGGIVLGAAPGRPVMTPFDLIPGADIDVVVSQNPAGVTNIARLLATLDDDNDLRNGFCVSAQARELAANVAFNFNQSIELFAANGGPAQQFIAAAAPDAANGQFISVAAAQAALQETANQIRGSSTTGSGADPDGAPNQLPVANAGSGFAVDEDAAVTLSGSGQDADGQVIAFEWSQISGTPVTLSGANQATVSFTAPQVTGEQVLVFSLVVTDNDLGRSQPSTVSITVRDVGGNLVPTANAGADQLVDAAAAVTLAGSGADSDGSVASFQWTQTDGPPVTLADADQATARFTAPNLNVSRTLSFQLTVTDNQGAMGTDRVTITVRAAEQPVNEPPQAAAGQDQTVNEGADVTLLGSGADSDGQIASFAWMQTAGPDVSLTGANTATLSFTAPAVDQTTQFDFSLTVTDNDGATGSDSVTVFVQNNTPPAPSPGSLEQAALDAQLRGCDPLDTSACLFPFPSDYYTVATANSATIKTGRRLNFNPLAMPRNIADKPIDPTEWNRNDGFSPGPMIMTVVPGLNSLDALKRSYGLPPTVEDKQVGITNFELSLEAGAPIQVFEVGGTAAAPTATPHPVWAELDVNATRFLDLRDPEPIGVTDAVVEQIPVENLVIARPSGPQGINTALIIRPAKNLTPGKRYVVALRKLRNTANAPIAAGAVFAACKSAATSPLPPISTRCDQLKADVFPVLQAAGVPINDELFLAWDFTVASTENTTARLTHMRDKAFEVLKKAPAQADNCTKSNDSACNVPAFTVDTVGNDGVFKRVEGTLKVPSFVLPPDPSPTEDPAFREALVAITSLVGMFPGLGDVLGEVLPIVQSGSLPPNRLHYDPTDAVVPMDPALALYGDGLPDRLPQGGEQTTRFDCRIPVSALVPGAAAIRPSLYGHGLLGGKGEVGAGNVRTFSSEHGMMFCAIDWFGFATGDVPNIATVLVDASNFPVIPDASQQGFINWMFLSRVMQHGQGFAAHPEFQKADGTPVFDRREIFYDGNSQGGILPGPVLAVSKDLNRGVFGVPGMNYSTLLRRSVDFTPYSTPLYLSYQHELDRNLVFGLMQMLWDRSENNGYASYLTPNGRLDGQDNAVLLHPAYGDHQVSMWTADVMARTMNIPVDEKRLLASANMHPDVNPYAEIPRVTYVDNRAEGSAQVIWVRPGVVDPPIDETPPEAGSDPHSYPRSQPDSHCQKSQFLRSDGFVADTEGIKDIPAMGETPAVSAAEACRSRFAAPVTAPGVSAPPAPISGYGTGLTGAAARFFANLNAAVAAISAGDPDGTQAAFSNAFTVLAQDFQNILGGDSTLAGLVGVNPQTYAQNEVRVERSIEAVVITGAQIPAWSVPAAYGAPYPYPSGAGITNQGSGAENLEPLNQIRDPLLIGEVRSAHNGAMLYPAPGAPAALMGLDVKRIAAYKFSGDVFTEIPVQVDQRYPYFLANARSTFGIYSGTDEELGYEWDVEKWGNPGEDPGTETLKNSCNADFTAYRRGGNLHVPDPVSGLDTDDEIVFMYRDAGDRAGPTALPSDSDFDAGQGLQHVALVDPLNPGVQKWVYLGMKKAGKTSFFHGKPGYVTYARDANADQWIDRSFFNDNDPEKIATSNSNYGPNRTGTVCGDAANPTGQEAPPRPSTAEGYDAIGDRFPRDGVTVTTDTYKWRATGRWMVREVHVDNPGVTGVNYGLDLIDRWKGRAFQQSPDSTVSVVGFEDEQVNWEANSTLLGELCGPVRCIREVWGADSGTNVTKTETFYRDAVASRYHVRVHPIPPDGLYTSWDYNRAAMLPDAQEQAAGVQAGRYYTVLRPQGVPVDGVNDEVGQVDSVPADPITGMCLTSDGPRASIAGRCPLFFDAADPSFNLPLAFNNWEQVSGKGNLGSLVYVFELKGATSLANPLVVPYYRDDACLDDGTGDDPVIRPFPGEASSDGRVQAGYSAAAGGTPHAQLRCDQKQGAYGAHGVHYFVTHDSDNAFVFGKPNTEIDGQQWQIMVPTAQPTNVGARYANVIRAPVQAVVVARP